MKLVRDVTLGTLVTQPFHNLYVLPVQLFHIEFLIYKILRYSALQSKQ